MCRLFPPESPRAFADGESTKGIVIPVDVKQPVAYFSIATVNTYNFVKNIFSGVDPNSPDIQGENIERQQQQTTTNNNKQQQTTNNNKQQQQQDKNQPKNP